MPRTSKPRRVAFKSNRPGRVFGFTDEPTSVRMGRVRQRATEPELVVRHVAYAIGLRYRTRNRDLPGSPDLANRSKQWAVFVHGCFWHRHESCARTTTPTRNRTFWMRKFETNVERDRRVRRELRRAGWRTVVIWECETSDPTVIERRLRHLRRP
ncbi:MAG: DNA mismatch endonuclease Vsr [Thermoanaerobaculia bacterium]